MALIECPECNNQVSETAKTCPHCGYDIEKFITYCPYCEILKRKRVLMEFRKLHKMYVCPECSKTVALSTPEQEAKWAMQRALESNQPKCPTCQSTNISKVGTLNRMASVGLFGLASSKIGKTYKCNSCGSTW